MREPLRRSTAFAAAALTATTALGADFYQAPNPGDPGIPTAHACIVKDFGAPDDPIWFREPGAIAEGADSAMYTTSPSGGHWGLGAAFKMFPDGRLSVLFPFDRTHGAKPQGGLTDGKDGWLYGTASGGGTIGTGVLFRIRPSGGTPQVLYNFRNGSTRGLVPPCPKTQRCAWSGRQRADAAGAYPLTAPVLGAHGTFYGVTWYSNNQQFGTLYAIAPPYDSTGFKTLCIFDPRMARDTVMAKYICHPVIITPNSLVYDSIKTTLYGTTVGGNGAVFAATTAGKVTVLHQFDLIHGSKPTNIMQASNGMLYGTTINGGDLGGGTIWEVDPGSRGFNPVSSFRLGTFIAGLYPVGGLVEGKDSTKHPDGYLYGTTRSGGRFGGGTVYKILRGGDSLGLHVLLNFSLYPSGRLTATPPFMHSDGHLYGFTSQGGPRDAGVFYRISEQDLPELKILPVTFGKVNPLHPDQKLVPKDSLITVSTHISASGVNSQGKPISFKDGIAITVACRNPHFVQFISRENIRPDGTRVTGSYTVSSGSYGLTTSPGNVLWHSDAVGKPDPFYDHGPGAPWKTYTSGATTWLTMFDQPNFGGQYFPPSEQTGDTTSHRWRANFRTFALCNCGVVREVRWTEEQYQGKTSYTNITISPADNSMLAWINPQLVGDGFRRVP